MNTGAPGQADLSYRLRAGSAADCSAQWEWATAQAYVPLAVKAAARGPAADTAALEQIQRIELDDIALVDITCEPCSVARVRSRISRDTNDYIAVLINLRGVEQVATATAHSLLPVGAVAFWDTGQTGRFDVASSLLKRSLLIPREVMREALGAGRSLPAAPLAGTPANLLTGFLETVAEDAATLSGAQRHTARNAALELLAGLVCSVGGPAYAGTTALLRPQVDRWLDRNLHRPLTPAIVASAHAISVRSLHRMFQDSGESVGEVIRRRRLHRARQELVSTADSVSAIAHRWFFADASHFSRAFRAEFGSAPIEVRGVVNVRGGSGRWN